MENTPLVSVIIPAFNCEEYIEETINSLLNQTYTNWEAIIVDDCSTDSTNEIIKSLIKEKKNIELIRLNQNSGAAIARNEGIKNAKGIFLAFLDSDDVWKINKLEKQINFMIKKNYDFSCTFYGKIDEYSNDIKHDVKYKSFGDYKHLLKECPGNSTIIYNRSNIGTVYIPDIKKRNDYIMWLKVIKISGRIYCLEEVLSWHRVRNDSLSSNKFSLLKYHWFIYRKLEKLPFLTSLYLLSYWVTKSLCKKKDGDKK